MLGYHLPRIDGALDRFAVVTLRRHGRPFDKRPTELRTTPSPAADRLPAPVGSGIGRRSKAERPIPPWQLKSDPETPSAAASPLMTSPSSSTRWTRSAS